MVRRNLSEIIDVDRLRKLFEYDGESGDLTWRSGVRAGLPALGTRSKAGYLWGNIPLGDGRSTSMFRHVAAWAMVTGEWPAVGMEVDHIDGDPSNNGLNNLRLATSSQNSRNSKMKSSNRSGVNGVGSFMVAAATRWRVDAKGGSRTFKTRESAVEYAASLSDEHLTPYAYTNAARVVWYALVDGKSRAFRNKEAAMAARAQYEASGGFSERHGKPAAQ